MKRLRGYLSHFSRNVRAGVSVREAVILALAFFVVAIVMPIAIGTVANANVVNWETPVVTIFQILLPILAVIALALRFIPSKD